VNNILHAPENIKDVYLRALFIFGATYSAYYFFLIDTSFYVWHIETIHNYVSKLSDWLGIAHSSSFDSHGSMSGFLRTDVGAEVHINSSVDGLLEIMIATAAILAWPGNPIMKVAYLIAGVILFYVLAITRATAAFWTDQYAPLNRDIVVTWVLPSLLIFIVLAYFSGWILLTKKKP